MDYEALAKQFGGVSASAAGADGTSSAQQPAAVDYEALAKQFGGVSTAAPDTGRLSSEEQALQRAGRRSRMAGIGEQGPGVVGEGQGFSAPGPEGGLGQQLKGMAQGATTSAIGAVTGLPVLNQVLPSHEDITSALYGAPETPAMASGRGSGGIVGVPLAGAAATGLTRLGEAARIANLPNAARLAQNASMAVDPFSPLAARAVNVVAKGAGAVKNALTPTEAAATPTTNALRAAAQNDYAVMDNSNLAIHPDVLQSTIADIKKSLEKSRYVEELDPTAKNFLQVLEDRAQTPQSLTQLDALRGKARDLAYAASGGEQKVLSTISRKLDATLNDINPSNVVPKDPLLPSAAPDTVKDALISARDQFGRAAKSAEIETLIHKADASTTDNPIKALRTQFSSLAKNEDRLAQYSPAEQKVIKDIADGNIGSKSLQTLESLMPGFSRTSMFGNLMAALAGTVGHATTGPFGSLFFAAPGAIGKAAESARAAQAMPIANQFAANIRAGNVGNALTQPQFMSPTTARNMFLSPVSAYSNVNALNNQ